MTEFFDERKAIELAIADLKEQNRRDYELYLESRNVRNKEIAVYLDRLRELDERDKELILLARGIQHKKAGDSSAPHSIEEWLMRKESMLQEAEKREQEAEKKVQQAEQREKETEEKIRNLEEFHQQLKLQEKQDSVQENIRQENIRKPKRIKIVPTERVEPIVVDFLQERDRQLKDIQTHVQEKTGGSWVNFGEVMKKIMGRNPKVRRSHTRGLYSLDKNANNIDDNEETSEG
ncbi:hypothetical protein [Peribacillus sp. SCS-155]|uniref:Rok-like winged helix domain-containing protein n=1 Tax=Peribacillus sedimenti TaxID=3115297 RepID=UPI00390598D1